MDSTSVVRFTQLGGKRQSTTRWYLLEIDQTKILLDCGWIASASIDEAFEADEQTALEHLDAILIGHGDLAHLGGLPALWTWLRDRLRGSSRAMPVLLATVPVHHLGLVSLYDAHQGWWGPKGDPGKQQMPASLLLDSIDGAFEAMTLLRYSQPYRITLQITVTAVPAGHTLGGSMWRIQRASLMDGGGVGSNGDNTILYAGQFNHRREGHLDGAIFEFSTNSRPALLIVDGAGSLDLPIPRKQRDAELLEAVEAGFKSGGTVLMPVDTASRVLEVLAVLEAAKNLTGKIVLLSYQSKRLLDLLKGMIEWMGSEMSGGSRRNLDPWNLQHIQPITNLADLSAISEPRLVLASQSDLQGGMGRALFVSIAASSRNTLLMPWRPSAESLAGIVLLGGNSSAARVNVEIHEQVPLEGAELATHLRNQQLLQEEAAAEAAFALFKRGTDAAAVDGEEDEEGEGEDGFLGRQEGSNNAIDSARTLRKVFWTDYRHDSHLEEIVDKADPLYPVGPKPQPFQHQMFPFREDHRHRLEEDYGEGMEADQWAVLFGQPQTSNNNNNSKSISAPLIDRSSVEEGNDAKTSASTTPTKWISYTRQIQVRCGRRVLGGGGFEGLVDGRSLQTIIGRMAPRNLIIVGNNAPTAVEYLANHVRFSQTLTRVYNPAVGETVSLQSDLLVRQAILDEQLVGHLWVDRMGGDTEMAYLRGFVAADGEEAAHEESANKTVRLVESVSLQTTPHALARNPLMIGDPKLSDLVRLIADIPIQADFGPDGDLICAGGKVRIVRDATSEETTAAPRRLLVEGSVCSEYYQIRDLVYSQVAIL